MSQLRLFEGSNLVDEFKARFPGTVEVDDADVESLAMDDVVVIVAVATVGAVTHKRTKDGGLERIGSLGVTQVRVAKGEKMEALIEDFGFDWQLPLAPVTGGPSQPAGPSPAGPVGASPPASSTAGPGNGSSAPDDDELEDPDDDDNGTPEASGLTVQRTGVGESAVRHDPALAAFVTE